MTELPSNLKSNPRLDRWIDVAPDGTITIRSGKVELGQGIGAAMLLIAASELRVDPAALTLAPADTARAPAEGFTAGSLSVEHGGAAMRLAVAMARALFMQAAEAALGAPVELENGLFSVPGTNRSVGYGDLAAEVDLSVSALDQPIPVLFGEGDGAPGFRRPDLPAKLSGAAFIQDLRLPGMLFGRVLRPEAPWLRLDGFDEAAVAALPGVVRVVRDGAFAGVVAERDDDARAAIEKARRSARWSRIGTLPTCDEAQTWLDAPAEEAETLLEDAGEPAETVTRLSSSYARGFLVHAAMGPSCAVAHWTDGRLDLHTHSQGIHPLRKQLATALRIAEDAINAVHVPGAGCYGHNAADDVALDAALLARAVDRPVMVLWSREDEMSWSPHGAAMRVDLAAGLSAEGRITHWDCRIASTPHVARPGSGNGLDLLAARDLETPHPPSTQSNFKVPDRGADRNSVPIYALPQRRVRLNQRPQGPLRSSALRALGAHANVFAVESFMDELAAAAGADPLAFRLAHCEDPRAAAVLKAAASAGGWDPDEPGGEGIGRGLGVARYKNSGAYYAAMVRVEIEESVRVVSIHGAVDAGRVVHRDGLINQVEGGAVQAVSWTLMEEARWTDEGFAVRAWEDYPVLGFRDMPEIVTEVLRSDAPPLGAGECSAGPVAGAIGNAVAHALGVRARRMPITRERVMAAMDAAL
ncbi:molybdopterin cofactor-binding domain-containing protein [Histidinibacterium lentulum]|uniref:Xanthine dehydrogenase family protein molybdopterin-binding subunit n=1 Tax=Histidinibacterium lentulum TaxID=2480588 RepID=A0A3N2R8P4_9RHOB|nr:molybdopterin cofactor-binding domain-containing protein [Histidinibacterium lentulum]ROU03805.1 xanthine dehydrogenase family protein molybdopterin-binding subunit [Histidinibacterium lentulum]